MPDIVPVPQVGDPITARWGGAVANAINSNTPQVGHGQTPSGRVGDPPPPDFSSRARAIPYGVTLTPNGDATDDSHGTLTLMIHEPSMAYTGIYNPYNFLSANRPRGGQYVVVSDDIPADFSDGLEVFLRVRYEEGICWFVARTGGSSYSKVVGLSGSVDTYDDSILIFSSIINGTDREYVPQVSPPIMMPRPASNPDIDDLCHVAQTPVSYFYGGSLQRNALTDSAQLATSDSSVSVSTTTAVGSVSLAGFWDAFSTLETDGHTLDGDILAAFTSDIGAGNGDFGGIAIPSVCFSQPGDHAVPASRRDLHYISLYHIARWLRDKILQWAHDYTDEKIEDLEAKLNDKIETADNALSKRIDDLSSGA